MNDKEYCRKCGNETGKAGRGDDSLFTNDGKGPYCEECWDKMDGRFETKTVGGKTYVTVKAEQDGSCIGCAAQYDGGLCEKLHTGENGVYTPDICASVNKIFVLKG